MLFARGMVALKGQNHGAWRPVVLPFQGESRIAAFSNPGRCPGLICFRPFGARSRKTRNFKSCALGYRVSPLRG
jgi:hypothetical protein